MAQAPFYYVYYVYSQVSVPGDVRGRYLHTSAIVYSQSTRRVIHFGGVDVQALSKSGSPFDAIPMAETVILKFCEYTYILSACMLEKICSWIIKLII